MSRARILVLFAAVAMTMLLGTITGGGRASEEPGPPATSVVATTSPVATTTPATCPAGAECAERNVGGTTKTTVVGLAVAGGVALIWCRHRAKRLLAG